MHQQIRIAADRRGEVRILLERQAEMADVGLLIDGLSERANHQPLEQRAVRPRRQPLDQLAKFARASACSENVAPTCSAFMTFCSSVTRFSSGWPCTRYRLPALARRSATAASHVGGDHALLDQAVRIVAHHRVEALDPAVLADARLDLAAAKIERAARIARRFQARRTRAYRFSQRGAHLRRVSTASAAASADSRESCHA